MNKRKHLWLYQVYNIKIIVDSNFYLSSKFEEFSCQYLNIKLNQV